MAYISSLTGQEIDNLYEEQKKQEDNITQLNEKLIETKDELNSQRTYCCKFGTDGDKITIKFKFSLSLTSKTSHLLFGSWNNDEVFTLLETNTYSGQYPITKTYKQKFFNTDLNHAYTADLKVEVPDGKYAYCTLGPLGHWGDYWIISPVKIEPWQ